MDRAPMYHYRFDLGTHRHLAYNSGMRKLVIAIAALLVAAGIIAAAGTASARVHDDGIRVIAGA